MPSKTQTRPVGHRVPISEARHNLGQLVRRVNLNNEYFILEKDGIPIAGLMNVDDLDDWLDLQDPELQQQIEEGYEEYRQGKGRDPRAFLAEIRSELAGAEHKEQPA